MKIISVTEARKNLYTLIKETNLSREPIHITGKQSGAVLVSEDDWHSIEETLYLLGIPGMKESIIEGGKIPPEELLDQLT